MTSALSQLHFVLSQKVEKTEFDKRIIGELNDILYNKYASISSMKLGGDPLIRMTVGGDPNVSVGGADPAKPRSLGCGRADCDFNKWR